MKKVYTSKIGLEFVIPLVLSFGTALLLSIIGKVWLGVGILLPAIFFVIHVFMTTNYTIEAEKLTIKCGFLTKTIDIRMIKKISETQNSINSPATSLDRLEISFGKSDSVLISPKLKNEFINEITLINPLIEIKMKYPLR